MTTLMVDTTFQLSAPMLSVDVDVRLRLLDGRWVARANIRGRTEIGLGRTAREALTAALGSLTVDLRRALLADVALFAPSVDIQRAAAT